MIINGPNLNLLGRREPEIYGKESFENYFEKLKKDFPEIALEYFQSNIEGEIIDKLQQTGFSYDGIILNPGGYSHTSVAIADAVAAITTPVVEVHVSNIFAREEFRRTVITARHAKGVIAGLGIEVYRMALSSFFILQ